MDALVKSNEGGRGSETKRKELEIIRREKIHFNICHRHPLPLIMSVSKKTEAPQAPEPWLLVKNIKNENGGRGVSNPGHFA